MLPALDSLPPQLPPPVSPPPTSPAILDQGATVDPLEMILAGLAPQSREGYRKDLGALARFLGLAAPGSAVVRLLSLDRGAVNALAGAFTADMLTRGLSPATIRRRNAALCRVFKAGRRFSPTEVTPEVELPRTEALRDTAGPGKRGWERMLEHAEGEAQGGRPKAVRDLAAVLLLHDRGIRRGELVALDWPTDFDLARRAAQVL